jgi:iron-sulfur cluster repair protein YtfE (RIC family)
MEDHRTVLGWFDWFAGEDSRIQKARILANILKAVAAHMVGEEEVFYPEAARCMGDRALIERALREHQHAKAIMAQLQAELPNPAGSLVNQLRAEIESHVQEEETQLFPLVRESGMDLYRIGGLLAARRVETLLEFRGDGPAPRS